MTQTTTGTPATTSTPVANRGTSAMAPHQATNGTPAGKVAAPGATATAARTGRPRSRRGAGRATTLAVVGLGTVLVVAAVVDGHALRMTAALIGCLVLPGLGWARRLRLRDLGDTAALSVVLSLAATAIVATTMVVLGRWSPPAGLIVLSGVSVLGFVRFRTVIARAGVFLFGRTAAAADALEAERAVEAWAAEEEWRDWYADVRQQVDQERRRREAEGAAAEREWRDWMTKLGRSADEERRPDVGEAEVVPSEWWDRPGGGDGTEGAGGEEESGGEVDHPWTDSVARRR